MNVQRTTPRRPRPLQLVAALSILVLVSVGCAGSDDTAGPDVPEEEGPETTQDVDTDGRDAAEDDDEPEELYEMAITVSNHPVQPYSPPFVVAVENGYFEDEGILVTEIIGGAGGGTPVRSVLTADLPFGLVSTPAAANAYLAGAPLVAVGGLINAINDVGFATLSGSDMTSIEDVVGRSVGYTSRGSVAEVALFMSLERAGIDPEQVDTPALGGLGGALTALEAGGVDASLMVTPVFEADPDAYEILWWTDEFLPEYQQLILIANPQLLEDEPEIAEGFLLALQRAVEFINEDPGTAAELWAAEAEIDEDAARAVIDANVAANYYHVGFTQGGLEAVDEAMRVVDMVEADAIIPWEEFINQDFLPDDVERINPEEVGVARE